MNYNSFDIKTDDGTFIFVTRGNAKPFNMEEANEFLESRGISLNKNKEFRISDNQRLIFVKDIHQMGLKFCINKYGASEEQIVSEAKRIAPHINIRSVK